MNQQINEDNENKELPNFKHYIISAILNEPIICYKNSNFSTKKNNFIYEGKEYVEKNMKWIKIQGFKLYFGQKNIQCLHLKNNNTLIANKIILFNQGSYTNLASSLPFLLDISNHLKINIITYEYSNNDDEKQCIYDSKMLFLYLTKITTISEIILMGLSIGNIINMNLAVSKLNNDKCKIKAIIMISPIWKFSYIKEGIKNLEEEIKKLKKTLNIFFEKANINKINIFLIHGKEDNITNYILSSIFSKQIKYLSEWYPKNATHFRIIEQHRTKLLFKIKYYLNNKYSLSSALQIKNIKKCQENINKYSSDETEIASYLIDNRKIKNIQSQSLKEKKNNNLIELEEFEKEYNIDNNSIIYDNDNDNKYKKDILSFKKGDIIPDNNNISFIG